MPKIPLPGSPGCALIVGALLLGFPGLMLTLGSLVYGLLKSDGDPLTNLGYLGVGIVLLVIAGFFAINGIKQPESHQGLFSSDRSPLERAARAKTKEERKLAGQDIAEGSKNASQLRPEDREFLERIRADIVAAPSHEEILAVLSERDNKGVVLANPLLQPVAFALRPSAASSYIKGVIFEILIWTAGIVLLPFLLPGVAEVTHKGGMLYKALRWRRRAKRYRVRPFKALRSDNRDPILYLRSFSEDYEDDPERYLPKTIEEKVADSYKQYGPVITVGQPEEELPLLGASRVYFDESCWKAGVLYLMSISRLVIIEAGFAPGLLWELGIARQRVDPQHLSISFAAWSALDEWRRHLHYLRFKAYAEELLGCELPPDIGKTNKISFEIGWISRTI